MAVIPAPVRAELEELFIILVNADAESAVCAARIAYEKLSKHNLTFANLMTVQDSPTVIDFGKIFGAEQTAASLKADIDNLHHQIAVSRKGLERAKAACETLRRRADEPLPDRPQPERPAKAPPRMVWTEADYDQFIAYAETPGRREPISQFAARLRTMKKQPSITDDQVWGIASRFKESVAWWDKQSPEIQGRIAGLIGKELPMHEICRIARAEGLGLIWPMFILRVARNRIRAAIEASSRRKRSSSRR